MTLLETIISITSDGDDKTIQFDHTTTFDALRVRLERRRGDQVIRNEKFIPVQSITEAVFPDSVLCYELLKLNRELVKK